MTTCNSFTRRAASPMSHSWPRLMGSKEPCDDADCVQGKPRGRGFNAPHSQRHNYHLFRRRPAAGRSMRLCEGRYIARDDLVCGV